MEGIELLHGRDVGYIIGYAVSSFRYCIINGFFKK